MKYYAGIGARSTPDNILKVMSDMAHSMARQGFGLRSGGAAGADMAFELAAHDAFTIDPDIPKTEIFTAADCTTAAACLAATCHPNWNACSDYVRKLHGRNAQILLGRDLKDQVAVVICWTPYGRIEGGTGQSIRMANELKIPVINLAVYSFGTHDIRDTWSLDMADLCVPYTPYKVV